MAHIMCGCRDGNGWRFMNKRRRAICDAVAAGVREGVKGVHIRDDAQIGKICAEVAPEEGALKRPDLITKSLSRRKGKRRRSLI
jgi:hypothetical protein